MAESTRTVACPVCSVVIPTTTPAGRPRVFCSPGRRKAMERERNRIDQLITKAEKVLQDARAGVRAPRSIAEGAHYARSVPHWEGEVARLRGQLARLLDPPESMRGGAM